MSERTQRVRLHVAAFRLQARVGGLAGDYVHVAFASREQLSNEPAQCSRRTVTECGGGCDLQNLLRWGAAAKAEPSKQQRDFCRERAGVEVRFVEHDHSQVFSEEHRVLRTAEHVFEHRVVRDHDFRHTPARLAAGNRAAIVVFQSAGLAPCLHPATVEGTEVLTAWAAPCFGRFARKMEYADALLSAQPAVKPFHLVVHQRVHRVENQA